MAIRHVPPKGIWPGLKFTIFRVQFSLLRHTWQCGQRFTGIRISRNRCIGYQTYGDAKPTYDTFKSGGWYWFDDYFTKRGRQRRLQCRICREAGHTECTGHNMQAPVEDRQDTS